MKNENQLVKAIDILLVEDNPGDADLAREALENSKLHNRLNVVDDGEKAILYLNQQGIYAGMPRPDLILLDLNLPRKDGREVLADIKADDSLKLIPVVILTTSQAEEDVLKTYNLHANCYVTKPIDLNQFLHVIKTIENFWLSIVVLPPKGNNL
jgi:two-component system, chemotaxis family, response regulator Rcp1